MLAPQFFISSNLKQCNVLFFCMGFRGFSFQELQGEKKKCWLLLFNSEEYIYSITKFPGVFVWLFFSLDDRVWIFFRNSSFECLVITVSFN